MILSYNKHFIFIKTRKTGGTSVEIALTRSCGRRDIISPITPRDEFIRLNEGRGCQNFSNSRELEANFRKEVLNGRMNGLPRQLKDSRIFYNHMPYSEVADILGPEIHRFHTVTIERHPYDKAISLANFTLKSKEYAAGGELKAELDDIGKHVDQLIHNGQFREKGRNWDVYSHNGEMAVDTVLQHSTLQEDLQQLCAELDLAPESCELPMTKVGNRDRSLAPEELLTTRQKRAIQEICREEFEYFGYYT